MTHADTIYVETLETYTAEVSAAITSLMPQLDESFLASMTEAHFNRYFKGNSERSILLAHRARLVLGTAVMTTMVEQTPDSLQGYMGGFVVDSTARGSGVAAKLWEGMLDWCRDRELPGFTFNTENLPNRVRAIPFYKRMGAQLIAGTDSHYYVPVDARES